MVDILYIIKWYIGLLILGTTFLPFTFLLFKDFRDKGYIFSKIIAFAVISYFVFIFGLIKLIPFELLSIIFSLIIFSFINYFIVRKKVRIFLTTVKKHIKFIVLEEALFFAGIIFWAHIRANMPQINGLEKFMDFGFLNSILRSGYFPPKDMWYTPLPINYYYFGHLVTAVVTKLTQIPSFITYNLMLSTLFSLTFTASFSICFNFFMEAKSHIKSLLGGLTAAILVAFGGNLTTIYTFFKPYIPADKPVPFWQLPFSPFSFPNEYWYPNATRFIPFTIHEFPIYSFVVSDLHGHVLDIPFVLLAIMISFSIIIQKRIRFFHLLFIGFLLSIMYMTNAWDGLIYFLLIIFVLLFINLPKINAHNFISTAYLYKIGKDVFTIFVSFVVFVIPFSIHFKPFVSGIGILCAPKFLTNLGNLGPFLFETGHCQKSPFWQLLILYGFFYFFAVSFILFLKRKKKYKFTQTDFFVLILISLSTLLIIVPEFIYVKDIYPMHYRANTMFKLVYEAFIMLSLSSAYILIKLNTTIKRTLFRFLFAATSLALLFFVLIYPVFAINSFYNNLQHYSSLNGIVYMQTTYPEDFSLINWINKNIKDQPVVPEANGDSYTNYARISTYTGLPTVIGWPVHEWLWRGTYDIVAPRIEDVQTLYTTTNISLTEELLKKYDVSFVVVSTLEKEKYPNLDENKFKFLGHVVYKNNKATLYKINN